MRRPKSVLITLILLCLGVLFFQSCGLREELDPILKGFSFTLQEDYTVDSPGPLNIPVENIVTLEGFADLTATLRSGGGSVNVGNKPATGDQTGSGLIVYEPPNSPTTAVIEVELTDQDGQSLKKQTRVTYDPSSTPGGIIEEPVGIGQPILSDQVSVTLSERQKITGLNDPSEVKATAKGVYVISGDAFNSTVTVYDTTQLAAKGSFSDGNAWSGIYAGKFFYTVASTTDILIADLDNDGVPTGIRGKITNPYGSIFIYGILADGDTAFIPELSGPLYRARFEGNDKLSAAGQVNINMSFTADADLDSKFLYAAREGEVDIIARSDLSIVNTLSLYPNFTAFSRLSIAISRDFIFVGDPILNKIRVFHKGTLKQVGALSFNKPQGIAYFGNSLYVVSREDNSLTALSIGVN